MAKRESITGVQKIKLNLNRAQHAVIQGAKAGLLEAGLRMLDKSVNMAPVDTGKLVKSAKLKINNRIMARGVFYGGDTTGVEVTEAIESALGIGTMKMIKVPNLSMEISYERYDKKGNSISLMLHEDLAPKGTGLVGTARKKDRGGKFLESPMHEVSNDVSKIVADEIRKRLAILGK